MLIRFARDRDRTSIDVDFESDSLVGNLEVTVTPEVRIKDKLFVA
ncbi:hypothetical protein [Amycolatopsis australiensis]|uniref:Uncharacterized protein n=1 Tax=Amycolatopsis australiensis TaxID=546364 RepID=A0A1K1T1I9_9PSEU|nr:hypothetical protein [Amycolatopsis australiensis]SFW90505.1 hypothetical protein SAMN04489730_7593 [Amycolatopsis australiensis]